MDPEEQPSAGRLQRFGNVPGEADVIAYASDQGCFSAQVQGNHARPHFSNGRSYYPLHGRQIAVPRKPEHHPDAELLRWHNEHVFQT